MYAGSASQKGIRKYEWSLSEIMRQNSSRHAPRISPTSCDMSTRISSVTLREARSAMRIGSPVSWKREIGRAHV